MEAVDQTDMFEAERPRLVGIASRVLGDHAEAQDVVQQAWLRLHATDAEIDEPAGLADDRDHPAVPRPAALADPRARG